MEKTEICSFKGCEKTVHVKKWGLCKGHNLQRYHGKKLTPLRVYRQREVETCPIIQCTQDISSRGLCASHASIAWRMSIHPSDLPLILNKSKCQVCGSSEGKIHLDHDHSCCPESISCGDCLRGILCASCNLSLAAIEKGDKHVADLQNYLANPPGVPRTREYVPATVDSHRGRLRKKEK